MRKYILVLNDDETLLTVEALSNFIITADASRRAGIMSEDEYKGIEDIALSITHKLYDAAGMDYDAAIAELEGREM